MINDQTRPIFNLFIEANRKLVDLMIRKHEIRQRTTSDIRRNVELSKEIESLNQVRKHLVLAVESLTKS